MAKGAKSSRKPEVNAVEHERAGHSRLWHLSVLLTALALWVAHSAYLSTLFENDRHFSHLADFEREMGYRTEMGLYFSYYKTLVEAPSFVEGLRSLMYDNVTEYGHTINTLQRFNLYPEVYLALGYRTFKRLETALNLRTQTCWRVNRGGDLPPIESCEGIGNLHYFYVYSVFAIAGSVLSSVFLIGVFVSDSCFGGLLAALCFLFNHGEATRVQWTPPLRESFGYPVFLAQILFVTLIIRTAKTCRYQLAALIILTTHFLLFWQFSQFALGTQLAALYVTYATRFIRPETMWALAKSFACSFLIAYGLLFGNSMLLSSLFSTSLLAIITALVLRRFIAFPTCRVVVPLAVHSILFIGITIGAKAALARLLEIHDDDHVFDILRSKFTAFANFHTRLYTCAPEFDFVGMETVSKLCWSLLLPSASVVLILVAYLLLRHIFSRSSILDAPAFGPIVYNAVQLGAFAVIAWLIMRLKLFATPHLCILSSLLASEEFLVTIIGRRLGNAQRAFVVLIVGLMAVQGVKNVQSQLNIHGEYSNPEQEALFEWINRQTSEGSVFAGSMPVMANVKLSTGRPIANHPHYEHEEIRNRTLKVYSMYSRKPVDEVHGTLRKMGVNYYIYQPFSCQNSHPRPGCTYREMWDLEDPANTARPSLCDTLLGGVERSDPAALKPFKLVYNSRSYIVFEV